MPVQLSGSLELTGSIVLSGSITTTGVVAMNGPITASAILSTGNITAQTLVVSTISSSVAYSSGSNIFGNNSTNRQTFTGSLYITGSMYVTGSVCTTSNIIGDQILSTNNGNGTNFKIGDDIWLGDINLANTMQIKGLQNEKIANVKIGSCGGTISGYSGSIGIGTAVPLTHAGENASGLVIQGVNGCRGIIEVWDGTTSGKAVFQQVNGTTYLGNLDKGTGTGELQLLVNGQGSSATTAMTLTKCGHIVVNNAPNAQADYGRMTISTCMSKFMNCSSQEHTVLNLSTCESDTPFGMKIAIFGGSCSCTRYASFQTGDHYITNQGNIVFQVSGGHVGIGCSTPNTPLYVVGEITSQNGEMYFKRSTFNEYGHIYMGSDKNFYIRQTAACNISVYTNGSERLRIVGSGEIRALTTIQNWVTAGGDNYTLDTMNAYQSIANGAYVDFNGMSGMILVNNWSNGAMTAFLVGGGNTTVMGTITGTAGTMHHSPGVGGYRWCNNYGSTANFGFQVFRTRNTA